MARVSTQEMIDELREVVGKFYKRISNAEAVGALEYLKREIMDGSLDNSEEDKET